jgi:ATP-dependent DNA ligase
MALVHLPFSPPLEPMLSAAADALLSGDGWLFEPKWDGFRTLVLPACGAKDLAETPRPA